MVWLSVNIYDPQQWVELGTKILATVGFVGFILFLVWFFGSRND